MLIVKQVCFTEVVKKNQELEMKQVYSSESLQKHQLETKQVCFTEGEEKHQRLYTNQACFTEAMKASAILGWLIAKTIVKENEMFLLCYPRVHSVELMTGSMTFPTEHSSVMKKLNA